MIIQSKLFTQIPSLVHGFSTKPFGNMSYRRDFDGKAERNNRHFLRNIGIDPAHCVIINPELRHGSNVAFVEPIPTHSGYREVNKYSPEVIRHINGMSPYADSTDAMTGIDACFSICRKCFISMRPADCSVVFVYDPIAGVYGLIHASVAGLFSGVVSRSLDALQCRYGSKPKNLLCFVSPSISAPVYRLEYSRTYTRHLHKLLTLEEARTYDPKANLKLQLLNCGVEPDCLELCPHCTGTESNLFFSNHRCKTQAERDREGRMLAIIGKK